MTGQTPEAISANVGKEADTVGDAPHPSQEKANEAAGNAHSGSNDKDDGEGSMPISIGTGGGKKKKRKNKSLMKRGIGQPTGFEEYYVDPPTTPAEHSVELELYDPSKDFQERIEIAVSRFMARRKFGEWQRELFDKYLAFGGFDTGPKPFSSFDPNDKGVEEEDTMTAAEIARLKAATFVSKWVLEGKGEVDFDGVLKAFISSYLSRLFAHASEQEIRGRVNVLRSFFNYLLHHDVCPEYNNQIDAARETCNRADKEIWASLKCAHELPGEFNMACSVIFGGYYHVTDDPNFVPDPRFSFGLPRQTALKIFQGGMAANSTLDMFNAYQLQAETESHKRMKTIKTALEVTGVEHPTDEVRAFYDAEALIDVEAIGKLRCKTWHDPNAIEEDLTEEEEAELKKKGRPIFSYEFWVEESLLAHIYVGMIMEVEVHETSFGLQYFDTVTSTTASFNTYIPNIDMERYKEPRDLLPRDKYEPPELQAYIPERGNAGGGDSDDEDPSLAKYEKGEDINIEV